MNLGDLVLGVHYQHTWMGRVQLVEVKRVPRYASQPSGPMHRRAMVLRLNDDGTPYPIGNSSRVPVECSATRLVRTWARHMAEADRRREAREPAEVALDALKVELGDLGTLDLTLDSYNLRLRLTPAEAHKLASLVEMGNRYEGLRS